MPPSGIMIVMVSATVFHIARGETSSAAITLVLFGIAAFVAYARHRVVPISGRGTTGTGNPDLRVLQRSDPGS